MEFSRRQIADVMSACDPTFRSTNKPTDNGSLQGSCAKRPIRSDGDLKIYFSLIVSKRLEVRVFVIFPGLISNKFFVSLPRVAINR